MMNNKFGGYFLIDKPLGITSFDVVSQIKQMFPKQKVGHCGTLDPLATGLLIVAVGTCTKKLTPLINSDKEYIAQFTLGQFSDTDDSEGISNNGGLPLAPKPLCAKGTPSSVIPAQAGIPQVECNLTQDTVQQALQGLIGEQLQTPPKYSAKSINGVRAYKLARAGAEVKLDPVKITIHNIELLSYKDNVIECKLKVSKGTYIRSIARTLGELLGTGAYMSSLQRTGVGQFSLENAKQLQDITIMDMKTLEPNPPATMWVGKFDGMHLGHQALLHSSVIPASSSVIPAQAGIHSSGTETSVTGKIALIIDTGSKYLVRIYDRVKYLYAQGFDLVIVQELNERFKGYTAKQFEDFCSSTLGVKVFVTTENQVFGSDQRKLTGTDTVPLVKGVSSSNIKRLLDQGDVAGANQLLGHSFSINGRVVEGNHLGRTIGFPTANVDYQNYYLPKTGVYKGLATVNGRQYPTIVNIGTNPTVGNDHITVEAHLKDYRKKDFYGKFITVEFLDWIRGEQKFDSLEQLKKQLNKDLLQ
jgi:tRNA pseudouridine55 synthase